MPKTVQFSSLSLSNTNFIDFIYKCRIKIPNLSLQEK